MKVVLVAALLLTPLLASCDGVDTGPRIDTGFYPLQYIAQRVAGHRFPITNLTKPGQEPHDTEISIKQTAELAKATLVFYESGLSAFVDSAVDTAAPESVVDASHVADLNGDDPHFWLDPVRFSAVATEFEAGLAKVDPKHADQYAANLARLQSDLSTLDADLRTGLAHCAIKTIVVSHDAFEYFGARYGLKVVAINGLSPDAEPSPAHIAELHDLITSDHITTVFSEQLASPAMANALAGDLGITTAVLDPIEGLSEATKNDDYLSLMRTNLASLRKANDCS